MPRLTRWMLKTSLLYLVLALLLGIAQAAAPFASASPAQAYLVRLDPVRVHLFVVGWITLLIFGVVYWMFPKFSKESPRGYEWLGWWVYGLLNAGLVLRIAGEGLILPEDSSAWVLILSALLQWLASLAFVLNTWRRVREK